MALPTTDIFMQLVSHKILSFSKQYSFGKPACSAYLLHAKKRFFWLPPGFEVHMRSLCKLANYLLSLPCLSLSFLWSHSCLHFRFIDCYFSWFHCFSGYSSDNCWEFPGLSLGPPVFPVICHFRGWLSPWPHLPCQRVHSLEYFRSISFECLSSFWLMSSFLYVFLSTSCLCEVKTDTSLLAFTGSSLSYPTCNTRSFFFCLFMATDVTLSPDYDYLWTRQ